MYEEKISFKQMQIQNQMIKDVLEKQIPEGFSCKGEHETCPYYDVKNKLCILLDDGIINDAKICDINI